MINVLTVLQKDMFLPRIYVAAAMDNMSLQKARVSEDNMVDRIILIFYRRDVNRIFFSVCFWLLFAFESVRGQGGLCNSCKSTEEAGKSVLCNGPGTCVPLCIIAFLFKVAGIIGHLFFMPRIASYRENILKFTMLAVSCG